MIEAEKEPTIPLKEHLETLRIADEKFQKEMDRRYQEVSEEKEKAKELALQLQHLETNRRLETLNGEAERITKVLSLSVPREVFEAFQKEVLSRLEDVRKEITTLGLNNKDMITRDNLSDILKIPNEDIKDLTGYNNVSRGKNIGFNSTWGILITIISLIIGLSGLVISIMR